MVRDHRSASTIRNHRREPQEAVWGGLLCVPDVLIPITSYGNGGIGQHAAGQGAPQHRERRRSVWGRYAKKGWSRYPSWTY